MSYQDISILEQIAGIERNFKGTKYDKDVDQLMEFYHKGSYKAIEGMIAKFPTEEQLLAQLVEKLQGKSVYTTLKKIIDGKTMTVEQKLKGVSSLLTHTVIEIEQGNPEYRMLLPTLYEKLGKLIYEMRDR